jgi:hypothetical protein
MAVMDTDNIIATLESHANLNGSKVAFEYLGRQSGGLDVEPERSNLYT